MGENINVVGGETDNSSEKTGEMRRGEEETASMVWRSGEIAFWGGWRLGLLQRTGGRSSGGGKEQKRKEDIHKEPGPAWTIRGKRNCQTH